MRNSSTQLGKRRQDSNAGPSTVKDMEITAERFLNVDEILAFPGSSAHRSNTYDLAVAGDQPDKASPDQKLLRS